MVRFETKLLNNAVKEWTPFYVDYRKLKRLLYSEDAASSATSPSTESLFASPRFRDKRYGGGGDGEVSGVAASSKHSDRAPLIARATADSSSSDSPPSSSSSSILPGEDDPTSSLLSPSQFSRQVETKNSTASATPILSSVFSGPPPRGTRWTIGAWDILVNSLMGDVHLLRMSEDDRKLSDVDVQLQDEDRSTEQVRDELGELSPAPSENADLAFRTKLLSEIIKVDTFYNDMVYDYEGQLQVLMSQAKRTEELGKSRRRERLIRQRSTERKSSGLNSRSVEGSGSGSMPNLMTSMTSMSSMSSTPTTTPTTTPTSPIPLRSRMVGRDIETLRDMDSPSRDALALASSKRAYADLYRNMCYLENYCILNYTAIVKIIKKHDKINPTSRAMKFLLSKLRECSHFPKFQSLTVIKSKHQTLYAQVFCSGDNDVAHAELLLKRNDEAMQSVKPFLLGFRFGICLLLLCWILWDVVVDFWINQQKGGVEAAAQLHRITHECHTSYADKNISIASQWFEKDFPVYRGMGSIILWLWCWGICLFVWNHSRINYLFMLELDPRITSTYTEVWSTASSLTIVLLTSFIIHFKVVICDFPGEPIPLGAWPLIPFLYILYKMLFPWNYRKVYWAVVFSVITSPFVSVTFLMNYVGDVMTSLVKPIVDMTYGICFFATGDFLQHLGQKGTCQNKDGIWASYSKLRVDNEHRFNNFLFLFF